MQKKLLAPVDQMMEAVDLISHSLDYSVRVPTNSKDEFAQLGKSFNQMLEEFGQHESRLEEGRRELKALNESLEQRVNDRTRELNQAKEAAESASKAKSSFLASMSHELRTPLNAILGFAELVRRDSALSPDHRESLETIGRSGEHLLALINDVLEFSKIEAGRLTLSSSNFNLPQNLDDIVKMFAQAARQKNIRLQSEIAEGLPRFVRTDQNKFRQILINLIGNAIKATEEGGVALRVQYKPTKMMRNLPCSLRFQTPAAA